MIDIVKHSVVVLESRLDTPLQGTSEEARRESGGEANKD